MDAAPHLDQADGRCLVHVIVHSDGLDDAHPVLQTDLDASTSAARLKALIEQSANVPVREQLLLARSTGTPMRNEDLLRDQLTGGEVIPSVALLLRWVTPEWPKALEELSSRAEFEPTRIRLRYQVEAALSVASDLRANLASLAEEMNSTFRRVLKSVAESTQALTVAAGDLQRNRDSVFEIVPRSSKGCRQAAEELMLCRSSVLASVQANGQTLIGMRPLLAAPHKAVLLAVRESGAAVEHAVELLRREGELLRVAQSNDWLMSGTGERLELEFEASLGRVMAERRALAASAELIASCRQFYARTVALNRNAIQQAELSLRRDQEVVFGWAMEHVSELRKCDRKFIQTVVEANGEALEKAPEEFRHDKEIVLLAVEQSDGWALQFASEDLKRDRSVVLAAVRRNGWALEHCAEELKSDRSIVLAAVQTNGEALEFAGEALKNDREVVLAAVKTSGGWALSSSSEEMRNDFEVVSAAVHMNGLVLEHASMALRANADLVLPLVQVNGLVLEHAAAELQDNPAVVRAAVHSNTAALQFASWALRSDHALVLEAVKQDGYALEFAGQALRGDAALVLAACSQGGPGVLEFADATLRDDAALIAAAVAASQARLRGSSGEVASGGEQPVSTWNEVREGPEFVQL